MSAIVTAWSMISAVALTICAIQLLLWMRSPADTAPLLAAIMAFAAGLSALLELALAKTSNVETAQTLLFWTNNVVFLLLVSMVWFVHVYLGHDRRWLLYLIIAVWTFCLAINWALPGNLTFTSLASLKASVTGWGETWYQPVGEANAFKPLSEFASLLIVVYVADAAIRSFRASDRRKAAVVGGAVLFFIIVAGIQTPLVDLNVIQTPYMISWAFVAIALALGIELVDQASLSALLSRQVAAGEQRWRALLENVDLGVVGLALDGTITYANRSFEDLLGHGRGGLLGDNIVALVPDGLRRKTDTQLKEAGDGPRVRMELPLVSTGGEVKQIRWAVVPVRDSDGDTSGFMAICEDVTAIKKVETELRSSERLIERFDRAAFLVEIGSGLAHELNQPLTAILSNAQAGRRLVKQEPIPVAELEEIFTDIANDSARAGEIIHSVRRLLQRGDMEKIETDFAELVTEVQKIVSGELSQGGISFDLDVPQDLPHIMAGPVEIQQVVMNLVGNAIHALNSSDVKKPAISLSAWKDGDAVKVRVSDNGPGLDEEIKNRLFEPFCSTKQEGLGMGLPISRRIVEFHDGKLKYDSAPGNGASFEFTVPIAQNEQQTQDVIEFARNMHH